AALDREAEAVAVAEARRAAIDQRRRELAERGARLEGRRAEAERQRTSLAAALVAPEMIAEAAAALAAAEARVEQCRASLDAGAGITGRGGGGKCRPAPQWGGRLGRGGARPILGSREPRRKPKR